MTKRVWVPAAVLFVSLLAATAGFGYWLQNRLDDVAEILDPVADPSVVDRLSASGDPDVPVCGDPTAIVAGVAAFHDAVEQLGVEAEAEGIAAPELMASRAAFDSFLLESAGVRLSSGPYSLVIRARHDDGGWCLDEAEFSIEE